MNKALNANKLTRVYAKNIVLQFLFFFFKTIIGEELMVNLKKYREQTNMHQRNLIIQERKHTHINTHTHTS
jgi:hypothetical protein